MKEKNFEEALEELEAKVEKLSQGKLPLDEAIKTFEEGVELFKYCNEKLKNAEQKVTKILKTAEGLSEEPLSRE